MLRQSLEDVLLSDMFLEKDLLLVSDMDKKISRWSPTTQMPHISASQDQFVVAQKADPVLEKYFNLVNSTGRTGSRSASYLLDKGVLMRKWSLIQSNSFV